MGKYTPPPNGDTGDPDRGWIDANPATGQEGSVVIGQAIEWPQREVHNAIEALGLTPADADLTQLYQAIANSRVMDIAFMAGVSANGDGQDVEVQEYGRLVLARAMRISGFAANAGVAPTGASLIIDITKNDVSIFATKPMVEAGNNAHTDGTFTGAAAYIDCVAGDVLVFKVTQVGSGNAGQKLAATLLAASLVAAS